jgi:outer membrane protein assembly factor BamB
MPLRHFSPGAWLTGLALLATVALAALMSPSASASQLAAHGGQPAPASGAGAPSDDWPQGGYGPGNTSYNSNETTIGRRDVGRLTVAWSVPDAIAKCWYTCGGSSASVVGGVVYQSTAYGVFAREAGTGSLLWHAPLSTNPSITSNKREVRSFPAVSGGLVLVAAEQGVLGSTDLVALSTATGQPAWTLHTLDRAPGRLTLADGVLYADAGQTVDAMSPQTGDLLWSHPGLGEPVVAGDRVLATDGFRLYALSASTGKTLWRFGPPREVAAFDFYMVANDVVYAGEGQRLFELSARDGTVRKVLNAHCALRNAAMANGVIYASCAVCPAHTFGCPGRPDYVEAISTATGKLKWRLTFGTARGAAIATPVVANGVIYLEVFDPHAFRTRIVAVGAASGKALWTSRLPIKTACELTVAEGKLFASLTTGMIAYEPG